MTFRTMALKTLQPRIGSLTPKRERGWQPDTLRGNRHQRGYGTTWERLRVAILERDSYLCQACLRTGRVTPATQVDHVIPKAHGGTDDECNLSSICAPCHRYKTSRESA